MGFRERKGLGEGVRRKEVGRGRRGRKRERFREREGAQRREAQGVEEKPEGPGLGCGFREG